jgi:hypothetical protein
VKPETFEYRIRQTPGKWNELGQIKFMLPNKHDVYLHDTPDEALFRKRERLFSHGCIRVQQPVQLAAFVLGADAELLRASAGTEDDLDTDRDEASASDRPAPSGTEAAGQGGSQPSGQAPQAASDKGGSEGGADKRGSEGDADKRGSEGDADKGGSQPSGPDPRTASGEPASDQDAKASEWTIERIRSEMDSGKNKGVKLPQPVPVHIAYVMAWVEPDGAVQFREDVYDQGPSATGEPDPQASEAPGTGEQTTDADSSGEPPSEEQGSGEGSSAPEGSETP